jgi:hypothetical protein
VCHNDILTVVIGTPEHPGRVRGRSQFVEIKIAFGKGSRRTLHAECVTRTEVSRLIQEALQAQAAQFHQQMAELLQNTNILVPADEAGTSPQQSQPHTQVSSNCYAPLPVEDIQVSFHIWIYISYWHGVTGSNLLVPALEL